MPACFEKRRVAEHDRLPVDAASHTLSRHGLKRLRLRELHASFGRAADDGGRERMLAPLFECCRKAQDAAIHSTPAPA